MVLTGGADAYGWVLGIVNELTYTTAVSVVVIRLPIKMGLCSTVALRVCQCVVSTLSCTEQCLRSALVALHSLPSEA